jgi:anti-sigma regulatory factor (Ser/Thr protein kinase)
LPDSVSIKRPARLDNIHECLDILIKFAGSQGFADTDLHDLRLVAEEALANIVSHAYGEDTGYFEMSCRPHESGGALVMEFRDAGIPFELDAPQPDLEADIADRPIGGLGVYLIKTLASDVRCRRERGENILTIIMKKRT